MLSTTSTYQPTVSPADALWTLYQSQTKKVRDAFRMRILNEEHNQTAKVQQAMLKESMTRAIHELQTGQVKHDARSLFKK